MMKAAREKRFNGINKSHGGGARMKKESKA